jgi:hypothetical protein
MFQIIILRPSLQLIVEAISWIKKEGSWCMKIIYQWSKRISVGGNKNSSIENKNKNNKKSQKRKKLQRIMQKLKRQERRPFKSQVKSSNNLQCQALLNKPSKH